MRNSEWLLRSLWFVGIQIIFSFNFISPFTYSVLGQAKSDMILGIFENNYSSTYKALEMIFTNPFLQVFYA